MRQQALRAAKTNGSQKVIAVKARQSQSKSSSTDGRRLVHQKIPLSTPLPFPTNRRHLFNWSRWDGRLWETTALWAYHKSRFVHVAKHTQESLRLAQTLWFKQLVPRDGFWYKHYRGAHIANHSIQSFHLLRFETSAIMFILKTSPAQVDKRILHTLGALDTVSYEFALYVEQLQKLRNIRAQRTHNPLYFIAAVDRLRRTAVGRHNFTKDRIFEKNIRTNRKLAHGRDWKDISSRFQYTQPKAKANHWQESFVIACNACPPRWTIEPVLHMVAISIGRLNYCSSTIEDFSNASRRTLSNSTFNQIRELLRMLSVCSWDLGLLSEETAALRYYRLHHFPDSFRNDEPQLWKQYWQRSAAVVNVQDIEDKGGEGRSTDVRRGNTTAICRPVSLTRALDQGSRAGFTRPSYDVSMPSDKESGFCRESRTRTLEASLGSRNRNSMGPKLSVSPRTTEFRKSNAKGLFSWTNWNGQVWDITTTKPYRLDAIAQDTFDARVKLIGFEQRARKSVPYQVDIMRISLTRSRWKANRALLPFLRLLMEISTVCFLLRTAPAGIKDHVLHHVNIIEPHAYALRLELEDLRKLQIALFHLPHDPLLFLKHVMEIKTRNALRKLKRGILVAAKVHRSNLKSILGPSINWSKIRIRDEEARRQKRKLPQIARAQSWAWQSEQPFAIVEPFQSTVVSIMTRLQVAVRIFTTLKDLFIRAYSYSIWLQLQQTLDEMYHSSRQILFLTNDLGVLRYYKLQHYPESVLENVIRLDQALAAAIDLTRPFSKRKVPESDQSSVSGRSRTVSGRSFRSRRTSRDLRGSKMVAKPQKVPAKEESESRTGYLFTTGLGGKSYQRGRTRLAKVSQVG